LPVFCEKPLARTLADATAMRDAATSAGVPAIVNFSKRNGGVLALARHLIREGRIGTPLSASCSYLQSWLSQDAWGPWRSTPRWRWRIDEGSSTFGVLGDLGAHLFDALLYLGGSCRIVASSLNRFVPDQGIEGEGPYSFESFQALVLAGGRGAMVEASFRAPGHLERFALGIRGERASLEIDLAASRTGLRILGPGPDEVCAVEAEPVPSTYERFVALASGATDPTSSEGAESLGFDHALEVQTLIEDVATLGERAPR
jgi:predicted dehydrogenase